MLGWWLRKITKLYKNFKTILNFWMSFWVWVRSCAPIINKTYLTYYRDLTRHIILRVGHIWYNSVRAKNWTKLKLINSLKLEPNTNQLLNRTKPYQRWFDRFDFVIQFDSPTDWFGSKWIRKPFAGD